MWSYIYICSNISAIRFWQYSEVSINFRRYCLMILNTSSCVFRNTVCLFLMTSQERVSHIGNSHDKTKPVTLITYLRSDRTLPALYTRVGRGCICKKNTSRLRGVFYSQPSITGAGMRRPGSTGLITTHSSGFCRLHYRSSQSRYP